MRKYYFSCPNASINIEQTLPQYKVLTVLYTFLMIMNLNETNHHGGLVVLGKINKIVSCCLFDTHKLQLSTRQSFQRWANLEYSCLASRYWCQLKQRANKSQHINRLQRLLLMAVPSKTCCINTSKQHVQTKCFANNKYQLLKTDTRQKIDIWSHQQPETHQVSELWSDNKAKVSHVGKFNIPVYMEYQKMRDPEGYPPCQKPFFLPRLTHGKAGLP